MLLDELLAERERAHAPATPPPVLSVDPVVVPPTLETGRKAIRQRLAELESAARRNYRSAEEARRVLADEHQRLEQELNARTHAQHEAAALRRELERLSSEEAKRAAQERTRAEREARAQVAGELREFQEAHERVVQEMKDLRGSLSEHDGLLDEYVTRLREEQGARAALRAELERAEAARSLAERSLQRATENARHGAEDEMIRLATAEQELADARSDRDRLASQLADLTSGDGALGRLTAQLEAKDTELGRFAVRVADLEARIAASEAGAQDALAERDDALAARNAAEAHAQELERAHSGSELAVDVASGKLRELEAELAELTETTDARTREIDKTLGKLRREARDASNARRTAEETLATSEAEREELRVRVADLEAECSRARADGDRLRAHAAMLGDELAAARATVAELQAAAPAPPVAGLAVPELKAVPDVPVADATVAEAPIADAPAEAPEADVPDAEGEPTSPPPLPLRIAGQKAPAPPLARRRPRRDSTPSKPAPAPGLVPAAAVAAVALAQPAFHVPPDIAPVENDAAPAENGAAPSEDEDPSVAPAAETPVPAAPAANGDAHRRTALAEFTALATSSGDDFSFRRR